ncbi:MAG: Cob(I)yrinic acid a,c-diamide adenosyltransferase [Alphaproteobacteria bacterium MarineAlpha3_Bin5]|nr:ATP:cob(I)alamin adenosyltransferase [Magnetovibrio sp.]PPR77849.1 MAG: Cob(I)yrinic acid a,c-diamide adenosyltransferase [Alphaproteobacteria bacterium MarineAlpha3_Bin5]|tara:strand:- start:11 stop:574 length:564 start_codon:yes stop_codon:yes gene_type:complete
MVTLSKIYTKTGDQGETSLGSGLRVKKFSLRVNVYGTVDEANAIIGIARLDADNETDSMLSRIQNDLFDVGADLCRPEEGVSEATPLRVTETQVARLETEIDAMNTKLEPLKSFVLPGGSPISSYLHLGRTIVRRCERLLTKLAEEEKINIQVVKYLNRLSDHLFVLARINNNNGIDDVLWSPGKNR